jgi:flagellar biosynthetic protein FliR/FlhB
LADEADKTEPATPKKKEDARKKGQVAQSRDVSTVLLLITATLVAASPLAARVAHVVTEYAVRIWGGVLIQPGSIADFHALFMNIGLAVGVTMFPIALVFMVVGLVSNVVQIGWMLSAEAMAPKFEKMNPIAGMKRFVSTDRLYELGKSLIRLVLVVTVLVWLLTPAMPEVFSYIGAPAAAIGLLAGGILKQTVWTILAIFIVVAAIDYMWQRLQYEKRLRMTKQEVRDEAKQREGDPQVKSRIRQIQREVAQRRMFEAIDDADLVVVNPTHFAVALQYRPPEQSSPKVIAKGRNHVALRIRRRAEELGIPIVENPPVAQLLYKTAKVDREIPEELYQAVAEVLAYLYKLNPRKSNGWRAAS